MEPYSGQLDWRESPVGSTVWLEQELGIDQVTICDGKTIENHEVAARLVLSSKDVASFFHWASREPAFHQSQIFGELPGLRIQPWDLLFKDGMSLSDGSESDSLCAQVADGSLHLYRCYDENVLPPRLNRVVLESLEELDSLLWQIQGNPWLNFFVEME